MPKHFDPSLMSELRSALSQGKVLVFIGSGFSASAGIPSLQDLLSSDRRQGHTRSRPETQTATRSEGVAADVYAQLSTLNPQIPAAYRQLAALPIATIVTTNYDQLIEKALASVGKRAEIVLTAWDLQKPSVESEDVMVVKLFGDISVPHLLQANAEQSVDKEQHWRTLLLRCAQLFEYDVELFLGFTAHDNTLMREMVSVLDSGPTRRHRIFVTPADNKVPLHNTVHSDKTVTASKREVPDFLRQLVEGLEAFSTAGPVTRSGAWSRIRQYLRLLQTELRYSWTVDRKRRVLTHAVPFRLEIQDGDTLRALLGRFIGDEVWKDATSVGMASRATDYLATKRHVLLIGDPGCGKTTFLRSLVRSYANPPFPSVLPLFLSAQDLQRCEVTSVTSLLKAIEARVGVPGFASAAEAATESQDCLFVIDALDELDWATGASVMNVLRQFSANRPNIRYIASCRPHLAGDLLSGDLDAIVRLAPLDSEQIRHFLTIWFEQRSDADQLCQIISSRKEVFELAQRPLFLGMLAYLWTSKRTAAVSVASLYEGAVRLLLGRWDMERGITRNSQFDVPIKTKTLVSLALYVVQHQHSLLSTNEVIRILSTDLDLGPTGALKALDIVEEIERQSGLFGRMADDRWGFVHAGFIDYLCSKYVLDTEIDEVAAAIAVSSEARKWSSVLAMAGSALNPADANRLLRDLIARVRTLGRARDICERADQQRDLQAPTES